MDQSGIFARHFARLVSLLMHEVGNVDEQKMSLRALVTVSKSGPVTLVEREGSLLAGDAPVPGALTGVADVVAQMAGHSIRSIEIGEGSPPADVLGVARIVAGQASPGDGGARARERLAALRPRNIRFETPEPVPAPDEAPTLVHPSEGKTAAEAYARRMQQEAPTVLTALAPTDFSRVTADELFAALDGARGADATTKALDDLVALAEHAVRVGRAGVVGDVLHGVVAREQRHTDADVRRAFVLALRRLSKPALLRAVASLFPKKPERRQHFMEVMARAGEEGADALIEQVRQAQTTEDRKTLFTVLTALDATVPALVRMLGDSRWFVVRNAADLLGEMNASAAEGPLVALLRHADDRVRRSATNALLRLGTPDALKGIYEAVSDSSPEVRMHAAAALSNKKDTRTSATLIRAIEEEGDPDVQLAMIAALGRVATQEAVQKLVKMAEPEQRLFRKKAVNLRVAAVQALGEARTSHALSALRDLAGDKEREVRETATRALAHASR